MPCVVETKNGFKFEKELKYPNDPRPCVVDVREAVER
jgi:hypothetical protein